jgi:predicted DNA-binding transcriptional regulator YafY
MSGSGQFPSAIGAMLRQMAETASRLLDLLSLLQTRRDWSGAELSRRLEVSERTVRRDVERLRRLGYPVDSLTGPAGGYRLQAGTAMPPLLLDDGEAIAIAVGLRTAARAAVTGIDEAAVRALVKLEQVLPKHLRPRVAALAAGMAALPPGGPTVDPEQLTVLAGACRDHELVRFAYRGRDAVDSSRHVEPYGVVNSGRRWYLVAFDRGRDDWRTFRVDRLWAPRATGMRFPPRELPAPDAATFVARSLRDRPMRFEARVTVHAPADEVRARLWGTVVPIDDARCEFRTGDDDLEWLALRVAMIGADYEVHEPPELVERLRALAARVARATGG